MRKQDRRDQLLMAAREILVARGTSGVTMERLAAWAGVSKALPYSHFENSNAVLVAVYDQVIGELGQRILGALESAEDAADADGARTKLRVLVTTYLDAVCDIGKVLGVVTAPGSRAAELGDADGRLGVRFLADILDRHFSVPPERARLVAPIMLPMASGAVAAWLGGDGTRAEIEALLVDLFETALGASRP